MFAAKVTSNAFAQSIVAAIRKKVKGSKIDTLDRTSALSDVKEWIPSGFVGLDDVLGGGWAVGRASEVFGDEGCLVSNTEIVYQIRDSSGRVLNSKGGRLERLYERFHRLRVRGKGKNRMVPPDAQFFAPSFTEDGRIVQNRIVDVKKNGRKPCHRLHVEGGLCIDATLDHEFWTGSGYVELGKLRPGDVVFVHDNARVEGVNDTKPKKRSYLSVKSHPVAGVKLVDGRYRYHRLARSRAVIEADMNGLELSDYVDRLNSSALDGLTFLRREQNVHHLDEDCSNDDLGNLEVKLHSEHAREHAIESIRNLSFVLTPRKVVSIGRLGARSVYDLVMAEPYRNFIAGKFAVHNCGKTAIAHQAIKGVQDLGGYAVLLDFEAALDEKKIIQLGIDPARVLHEVPDHIEQGWDIVWAAMERLKESPPDAPVLIVWDSIGGAVPKAELDAKSSEKHQVGETARAMSKGCRRMFKAIAEVRAHMMWISQERHKIGGFSPFGPVKETSGGKGPKYAASQRLRLARVKTLKEGTRATGYLIKAITKKNRLAAPEQSMEWVIDFRVGPSPELTLLACLQDAGRVRAVSGRLVFPPWGKDKPFRRADWLTLVQDSKRRELALASYREVMGAGGPKALKDQESDADVDSGDE